MGRFKITKLNVTDDNAFGPSTIVYWGDGTKTIVKCQNEDTFNPETGIAMCFMKKALGNKSNFNNVFKKIINSEEKKDEESEKSKT